MSKKWINSNNRVPPNEVVVLGAQWDNRDKVNMYFYHLVYRLGDTWIDITTENKFDHSHGYITHWMPLPESPDKEDINEEEIAEKFWELSVERIKNVVENYLSVQDIKDGIFDTISTGVKEYLQEIGKEDLEKILISAFKNRVECGDVSITFK